LPEHKEARVRIIPEQLGSIFTPALLVDLNAFESNVKLAEELALGAGKVIRPHAKTHRCPGLALRQLGKAAKGIACATVREAEAMAEAGIRDILLANEVVSQGKIDRVIALSRQADIMVAVDAKEIADAFSAAARQAGVIVGVLVDVNVGLNRCGVGSVAAAVDLAAAIERLPALALRGIMGYEGRRRASDPQRTPWVHHAMESLAQVKDAFGKAGLPVEVVSASGTSTLNEALAGDAITEIQAGSYISMEKDLEGLGLPFVPSVWVLSSVISRTQGRAVLDAGRRSVGMEYGPPEAVGVPSVVVKVNDEHTILQWNDTPPALGRRVVLRPGQVRSTFNLNEWVHLIRDNKIVETLPISARGSS
jgi:D-serine deaminase-like pyridoxal phosphate-dependent protein